MTHDDFYALTTATAETAGTKTERKTKRRGGEGKKRIGGKKKRGNENETNEFRVGPREEELEGIKKKKKIFQNSKMRKIWLQTTWRQNYKKFKNKKKSKNYLFTYAYTHLYIHLIISEDINISDIKMTS